MNGANDLSLDSFLDIQQPDWTRSARQPQHPLRRALLASVGAPAGAVCRRVLAIAAAWLGMEPPVAHWAFGAPLNSDAETEDQDAAIVALLDQIARRKLADDLRLAGYDLQTPEELAVWIVVGDESGVLPDPAALAGAGDMLRRLAWSRMRAQATVKLMVMVEPADVDALMRWRRQVAAYSGSIHFSSPINLRHLRLDAADYEEQTAVALAALLCGNFPSHSQPANGSGLAVGAAAWTAPIAAVRRGLALHSALHTINSVKARLDAINELQLEQSEQDAPSGRIPSLEQSDLDLAATVTPALPAVRWRDFGLTWGDLGDFRTLVQERMVRREERHEQAVRSERLAWLDQRMCLWNGVLAEVDQFQRSSGEGAPPLEVYQQALSLLDARFRHDLDALATALERSDQRIQVAEEQVEAAWKQVETLCGQLPQATTKGILIAALQPWMWPVWPYAFRSILPQEGQRLLDSMAYRSKVRWHEANWHILRQTALAMSQDVNRRLHGLEQLRSRIETLSAYLVTELEVLPLPAPWTQKTVHALWSTLKSQISALAAFPDQEHPLDWQAETPERCGERLAAHFEAATTFVEGWTVLDCLAQPFLYSDGDAKPVTAEMSESSTADSPLPPGCLTWLTDLVETALPLWPDPAIAPVAGPVGWCLLPQPAAGIADSGYGPDTIRHWCESVVNLSPATLTGQTLAILRWAPVDAGDERSESLQMSEEVTL